MRTDSVYLGCRRSTASHAIEEHGGRTALLRHRPRSQNALWVVSLAVSSKDPRVDEQAAVDAIGGVENLVVRPEYEPNGRDTAPDWRVRMAGGRVADVEVIRGTNRAAREFTGALSTGDSAKQTWHDERLSWEWTIVVSETHPTEGDRTVGPLKRAVCDALVGIESQSSSPIQMRKAAGLELASIAHRHGGHTRNVDVMKVPLYLGEGRGRVQAFPSASESGMGDCDPLVPTIQDCIAKKAKKRSLDTAPGMKWLAIALEGMPASQLTDLYGPNSPQPHRSLDPITFDYFDEVWVIARSDGNYTALRLSEGGTGQQSYVVPRS